MAGEGSGEETVRPLPGSAPPVVEAAPPAPGAGPHLRKRSLVGVTVLLVFTLSLYYFWLIYLWCGEVNWLLQRAKYRPKLLALVSLLTLGAGGLVAMCFFGRDLERLGRKRGTARRLRGLTAVLATLNLANLLLNLPPVLEVLGLAPPLVHRVATHYGLLTALWALAGAASVLLLQRELNLHAR